MKIITISREFGSGSWELGKRLSDLLPFDYDNRKIITSIAKRAGLDERYVSDLLERHGWQTIPITVRRFFASVIPAQTYSILTGSKWGDKRAYQRTLNTTHWDIKAITPVVAQCADSWFGRMGQ